MATALIVGSGFLGSALVARLDQRGARERDTRLRRFVLLAGTVYKGT